MAGIKQKSRRKFGCFGRLPSNSTGSLPVTSSSSVDLPNNQSSTLPTGRIARIPSRTPSAVSNISRSRIITQSPSFGTPTGSNVTLSAPPALPGVIGPLVSLVGGVSNAGALPLTSSTSNLLAAVPGAPILSVGTIQHVAPLAQQPQANTIASTPAVLNIGSSDPSLWKRALDTLSERDRDLFASNTSKHDYSNELVEQIRAHRDTCQQNRWKFNFRGKDIIVRDMADKILTWVDKFKGIGDIIVAYDPGHAALPWAGVRLLLQLSLSDKENMGVVMIGVERVARLLLRSTIHERLHLNSTLSIRAGVEEALVELYSAVLAFLACAHRYLTQSITSNIIHAILDIEGPKSTFDAIEEKESLLEKELTTAERESQDNWQRALGGYEYQKLRYFLEEMEKPITRIDLNVKLMYEKLQGHVEDGMRDTILRWLSQVEYIKHHENAKENLLEGTGQWLRNKQEFREWRSSSASGILWLRGLPGAGKTKLTCMVIDFLGSLLHKKEPVVYFYCNRNESQRRKPEVILQAIIKQLSVFPPEIPKPVVAAHEARKKDGLAAGSLGFKECHNMILLLLDIYPQTTIIIDALDESDPEERYRLLQTLNTLIQSSGSLVKIFVSSRDDIGIKLELEQAPNLYIDAHDNAGDIERFVIREITNSIASRRLLRGKVTEELKKSIISTIVGGAKGMFQWADLQIKHLYQVRLEEGIRERLGSLPKTLEGTYSQIWVEILSGTPNEQDLTPQEWAELSYWPTKVGSVDVLFDLCRNLVTWNKQLDRPVFSHLSVLEYLEKKCFNSMDANSMAAEFCFSMLGQCPNGYNTSLLSRRVSYVYPNRHWAVHVDHSCSREQHMKKRVRARLLRFLGVPGKPGAGYYDWFQRALTSEFRSYFLNSEFWRCGRLRTSFKYIYSNPDDPLFAICRFRFGEELLDQWELYKFDLNMRSYNNETFLYVAALDGSEWAMTFLLKKGAYINARDANGDTILMAAIKHKRIIAISKLVEHGAVAGVINKTYAGFLEAAAGEGSVDVMEAIIGSFSNIKITEAVMIAAVGNVHSGEKILEVLFAKDDNIQITEAIMIAAVEEYPWGGRTLELLLAREEKIQITEAVMIAAVKYMDFDFGEEILELLLARGGNIQITEVIMIAAIENDISGKDILRLLLARDGNIQITEAILIAAVGKYHSSGAIMEMLLASDRDIRVTDAVMAAAVLCGSCPDKRLWRLYLRWMAAHNKIEMPAGVLTTEAKSYLSRESVLEMLLDRGYSTDSTQTASAVAAVNSLDDLRVLVLLINKGAITELIEEVLVVAASNYRFGSRIMKILLTRYGNLELTETVMMAIANNGYGGVSIMNMLLERDSSIKISEEFMKTAVATYDVEGIQSMLQVRGNNCEITEAVVTAAATRPYHANSVLEVLFSQDSSIKCTERILSAAASNIYLVEALEFLLAKDDKINITESVMLAAAGNTSQGERIMGILLARDDKIEVTETIITAAAVNKGCGRNITKMLLYGNGKHQNSWSSRRASREIEAEAYFDYDLDYDTDEPHP